ncbi:MAG: Ig-like domain-containing protein [Terriglobales bacterium]
MSLCLCVVLFAFTICAHAAGPRYVAGSGFNPDIAGQPLTWASGQISYFTDQGDLSPMLVQSDANDFVAVAFSRWSSVPTAALAITRAGQLDEDVSGANVVRAGNILSIPADIQPGSAKALAIVYDYDGHVTDALLGVGSSADCVSNAVTGGPDRFTADGHIAHALLILNGKCIAASTDRAIFKYQLIRMIGRTLGLDWSQLNDNVATAIPPATADDIAGFPLMHPLGTLCTPGYGCAFNADQLRMDDRAAISRLYPVTTDNVAQFPGKTVFAASAARIRGHILFPDWNGIPGAGMQGVNVVARWIDPATGAPSHVVSSSSVSGFLFHGNAGNLVTGYTSTTGERFDRWGSADPALRGFYDLAGLELPSGSPSAQFQLSVEPVNPDYAGAHAVGPYQVSQVSPSGSAAPIVITVTRGGDVTQDIVMAGAHAEPGDSCEPHSFGAPAVIPGAGHWAAVLGDYGDIDWHAFTARAGHTFSLDVTALDDSASVTAVKALPVIGLWEPNAPPSNPPIASQSFFNAGPGVTRLEASIANDGLRKIAITDYRGDGRPDFRYRARLLYADTVSPSHASATGGTALVIKGSGFSPNLRVTVGGADAPLLSYAVDQLVVGAPALGPGTKDVALLDPDTGATAAIANAVSYGAGIGDTLQSLLSWNPPVPVGTIAPNPFRVRVLAADGTPVAGAAVTFTASSSALALLPCDAVVCPAATDSMGMADAWLSTKSAGVTTITAAIANGQSANATVSAVSSPLAIAATPPKIYVARNTTATVPLLVRVVGNGLPLANRTVEFQVMLGAGVLTQAAVVTDSSGQARSTLVTTNLASEVRISACVGVAPQTACDIFYVYPVAATGVQLLKAGGDGQYAIAGQNLAPVSVRVTDLSQPPNFVSGVPVEFVATAYRVHSDAARATDGEVVTGHYAQPVIVSTSTTTVYTNGWGEAPLTPQFPAGSTGLRIEIQASITSSAPVTFTLHTLPPLPARPSSPGAGKSSE